MPCRATFVFQGNHCSFRMEDGFMLGDGAWTPEQKPGQHVWASEIRRAEMLDERKRQHEVLIKGFCSSDMCIFRDDLT